MNLLEELNDKQYEAVVNTEGPCLIIAGAGSGKTKVLTHKIAYLISEKNIKPWDILAITFTNKAANEMKSRVQNLIGDAVLDMWIGTFHSICVRILRKQIERIGFSKDFIIFDTSDQKTLIKNIIKNANLDDKIYSDKSVMYEISKAKNEMQDTDEYKKKVKGDFRREKIAELYSEYQKKLKENNAIDFDDIINFTIKILKENDDLLSYYGNKFKYVLVDEYQDTNKAQFILVSMLASVNKNITVVGDNDQGIYSFRGADISNILNFEKDFPGSRIIKLEQNYRCTQSILDAANEVIKNNETKYEKKLWTKNDKGNKPQIFRAETEYDEANYIVSQINLLKIQEYYKYKDFAILYRMNSQSRAIEDIFRRENIPYKIVGGLKFYERKEIKDIIAYLRLIQNSSDNLSLNRIINEPKRGIGKTSLSNVEDLSNKNSISMYEIIKDAAKYGLNRIYTSAKDFVDMIEELKKVKNSIKISELIIMTLEKSGYLESLKKENTIEAESRIENLDEFLTVAMEYEEQAAEPSLNEFLEGITLSSDVDDLDDEGNSVTLMTLHSAKGLEFPIVFLVGMEEGIFPGYRTISSGDPNEMEEERRLCYVGITRAKEYLFFTCSKRRTIFGSTSYNEVSRFIKEIPKDMLDGYDNIENQDFITKDSYDIEWTYKNNYTKEKEKSDFIHSDNSNSTFKFRSAESFLKSLNVKKDAEDIDLSKYKAGVRVYHKKFGKGTINYVEEEGDDFKVDIEFEKFGHKRLMARFAGLEIVE